MKYQFYPENVAIEVWEADGAVYSICRHPVLGHYCGYVRFPLRFLQDEGHRGIVTYAPVHGGITYAEQDEDGSMVYGFDCCHAGDDTNPETWDMAWLRSECHMMATVLSIAQLYEGEYLAATTEEEKASILDRYHDRCRDDGISFHLPGNFGAMLRVLGGDL